MSPTQRSLAYLRKDGWLCAIVEHWNPHAKIRQDLFGIIDLLCLRDGITMGVQTTSGSNVSKRVEKIADCSHVDALRRAGWKLVVHGWRKGGNGRYTLREVDCS